MVMSGRGLQFWWSLTGDWVKTRNSPEEVEFTGSAEGASFDFSNRKKKKPQRRDGEEPKVGQLTGGDEIARSTEEEPEEAPRRRAMMLAGASRRWRWVTDEFVGFVAVTGHPFDDLSFTTKERPFAFMLKSANKSRGGRFTGGETVGFTGGALRTQG